MRLSHENSQTRIFRSCSYVCMNQSYLSDSIFRACSRLLRFFSLVRYFLLIFSLFGGSVANGQHFSVTGFVTDSSGTALANASIIVLTRSDSSLVGFSTSGRDGRFNVLQLKPNSYVLRVSFVGYETHMQDFNIVDQRVDLGFVKLLTQIAVLEEFIVQDNRLPFVVRGDTIEYHALAFFIRPQDMVEDLLHRLPGIDVDRSGTITAHGEIVENVLVEGKEFFSSDPTIATRNLPADAVNQVQVYDKSSDLAELTSVPDGQEEKTINLNLTEDAKKGFLGQATGGLGGEHVEAGRYFGRGTLFRFTPRTQFAWIGSGENVNQPVFSGQQLRGFSEVGNLRESGTGGYTESLGLGLNMNQELAPHTTIKVSYLLADEDNSEEDATFRHQLLGDGRTSFSNESRNQETNTLSHEIGLNTKVSLGEGHDAVLRGSFEKSVSVANLTSVESLQAPSGMLQNSAKGFSDRSSDYLRGSLRLTWRKRISQSGRSLIVESAVSKRNAHADNDLHTGVFHFIPTEMMTQKEVHQLQERQTNFFGHSQRLQLVQPLRAGRNLSIYLERSSQRLDHEKLFWDLLGEQQQLIENLGDGLYENRTSVTSGFNFGWRASDRSWFVSSDLEMQHTRRNGTTVLEPDQMVTSSYTYLLPYVLGRYVLGLDGSMDFYYRTSVHEPTTRQLQPFVDNSNSLRIYQGNPALTPEYHHDLNLQYRFYRSIYGLSLGVDTGISLIRNSIVRVRTIDQNLQQSIREINSDDAWSGDAGFYIGSLIYSLGLDWRLRGRIDLAQKLERVNGMDNTGTLHRKSLRLDLAYYRDTLLEITTSSLIYWNQVKYSLNHELNQNYLTGSFSTSFSGYIRNSWQLDVRFRYRIFDRDLFQDSQNIGLLHLSLSRFIFAGRGNISVEIHDLLNQNQRISFTNGSTYIQESRTESLGRYLMLKFTYKPKLM